MSRMADLWREQEDDRALFDMADEQLSDREVKWMCAYCYNEVPYEGAPCCGEVHSEPMPDDEERPAPIPKGLYELWKAEQQWTSGMDDNPNGHKYGCGCAPCMSFYRTLK